MKKVSTSQELKAFWNNFQKDYTTVMEPNLLSLSILLINSSSLWHNNSNQKKTILEMGCGGGAALEYIANSLNFMNLEADVYGTDLSGNMLETAYDRLKSNKNINLEFLNNAERQKINNGAKINIYLKEADNEQMPFDSNTFDLIIASLSLHLVSNPENMVKECNRILKQNSSAHFSVWGKPENCLPFTVIPKNIKQAGIIIPEDKRSNFHLSNFDTLRDLFKKCEIEKFKFTSSFIPFNFMKGEEYLIMANGPSFKVMLQDLSDEERINVYKNIAKDIDDVINGEGYYGIEAYIMKFDKI